MWDQIKAVLLLAIPSSLLIAIGSLLGTFGLAVATLLVIALYTIAYLYSDQTLLRVSQAQPIRHDEYPGLYAIAKELTEKIGIPTPRLYLIPAAYPIAFATGRGRNHAAIAISEGLIQRLSIRELQAIMAHQIAHIYNRSVWLATLLALWLSAVTTVAVKLNKIFNFSRSYRNDQQQSHFGARYFYLSATLFSCCELLAASRTRQYAADAFAAKISNDPFALATALRKLIATSIEPPVVYLAATASLIAVSPSDGQLATQSSTHPPTDDRIEKLIRMVGRSSDSQSDPPINASRRRLVGPKSAPGL